MERIIPPSELIINDDGSIFHLHVKPEQISDRIILVGDPQRVDIVAKRLDSIECDITNREFHTITGEKQGKRISIVSHGIGTDNMEIVINELDALVNIDFDTRKVKEKHTELTLVRVGTSGGLQENTTIGTYVAAGHSIGFDGVLFFYDQTEKIRDLHLEEELLRQLEWKIPNLKPYIVKANEDLVEQICKGDVVRGITIAANGFYAPQGRMLRLPLADPDLNKKIENFVYNGQRITNFEMESSSLQGLSLLMNHRALTVCCIIAGRKNLKMNTNYKTSMERLIDMVVDRI